jgi:Mrp family chromosome partitioning ATPase
MEYKVRPSVTSHSLCTSGKAKSESIWPFRNHNNVNKLHQSSSQAQFKSVDLTSLFASNVDPLQIHTVLPAPRPEHRVPAPAASASVPVPAQPQAGMLLPSPAPRNDRLAMYAAQQRIFSGFQNDIHTILEQMRASQRTLQIIGFAGADAGAGVSTICSSLAALSAEMEKPMTWAKGKLNSYSPHVQMKSYNVLLIDAQLHHPSIHSLFGVAPAPGLSAVLAGAPISQCIQRVLPHLHIVAGGDFKRTYLTQGEWLKLAAFIKVAQNIYSHIFIDLPALAQYPSGIDLARLCQAVTLVVAANRTRRHSLQQARALLQKNRIPVLGGILNRREGLVPEWLDQRM